MELIAANRCDERPSLSRDDNVNGSRNLLDHPVQTESRQQRHVSVFSTKQVRHDRVRREVRMARIRPESAGDSHEHATRLENFVAHAMRPRISLAWEWVKGSWPDRKALELCERIGAVPVIDPLSSPIPENEFVYLRIGKPTSRKQIHDDDLKEIALQIRDRTGWVVFSNPSGPADARRLLEML